MTRWILARFLRLDFPFWSSPGPPRASIALIVCLSTALGSRALQAHIDRNFPAQSQRALPQVTQGPYLLLDGSPGRPAPGARIPCRNDLLVLAGALIGQTLMVNVLFEVGGLVRDVWILSLVQAAHAPAEP